MDIESYIDYIRVTMKERHITQTMLAELSGVPKSTVGKVLARINTIPQKNTLDKLSAALNIAPFDYNERETKLNQIKEWFGQFDMETIREVCDFTEKHSSENFDLLAELRKIE